MSDNKSQGSVEPEVNNRAETHISNTSNLPGQSDTWWRNGLVGRVFREIGEQNSLDDMSLDGLAEIARKLFQVLLVAIVLLLGFMYIRGAIRGRLEGFGDKFVASQQNYNTWIASEDSAIQERKDVDRRKKEAAEDSETPLPDITPDTTLLDTADKTADKSPVENELANSDSKIDEQNESANGNKQAFAPDPISLERFGSLIASNPPAAYKGFSELYLAHAELQSGKVAEAKERLKARFNVDVHAGVVTGTTEGKLTPDLLLNELAAFLYARALYIEVFAGQPSPELVSEVKRRLSSLALGGSIVNFEALQIYYRLGDAYVSYNEVSELARNVATARSALRGQIETEFPQVKLAADHGN